MKSLAKDTAIYGLSSIIGKFLNYLLVPLYTYALARTSEYGIVTNIYAWTALLLVLLTYGMETGFFRFANREEFDALTVYKTSYFTLFISSALFTLLVIIFHQPIANVLGYPDHAEFVEMMFATVAIDAFASIPFAYLRYQKRPILFAALKLLFVLLNIAFNILFLIVLGKMMCSMSSSVISWLPPFRRFVCCRSRFLAEDDLTLRFCARCSVIRSRFWCSV